MALASPVNSSDRKDVSFSLSIVKINTIIERKRRGKKSIHITIDHPFGDHSGVVINLNLEFLIAEAQGSISCIINSLTTFDINPHW
jgi:hypothetical protein